MNAQQRSVGLALAAVLFASGSALAQTFQQTAVVRIGDPAPGTGGGTFSSFDDPLINASGDVAFFADVTGGTVSEGLFVTSDGVINAVAVVGDTAPGTGGGTYTAFYEPSLNARGDMAFVAGVTGGDVNNGIFVASGGTDRAVAFPGETAPGTGGGIYATLGWPSINASGKVAFEAGVYYGTQNQGLFLDSGGTDTTIALLRDPAPGTGASYTAFNGPSLNDSDDVAFWATFSSGTEGLFVESGGSGTFVARGGTTAPGTGGEIWWSFGMTPAINEFGDVAFQAAMTGGTGNTGFFVNSGGTNTPVALSGEPAPSGGVYSLFYDNPSISASGEVAFRAPTFTSGTRRVGIFVASGGTDTPVALVGDAAPGTGGGTYASLLPDLSIGPSGEVVFRASVTGGTAVGGIFKAIRATPPVPALGARGLVLVGLALAIMGGLAASRRRQPHTIPK